MVLVLALMLVLVLVLGRASVVAAVLAGATPERWKDWVSLLGFAAEELRFPKWTSCQKMCSRPSLVSCLSLFLGEDQNCPCRRPSHRPQGSPRLFCRWGRGGPGVERSSYENVGASLSLAGILGIFGWKAFKSPEIDCSHHIHLINGSKENCSSVVGMLKN